MDSKIDNRSDWHTLHHSPTAPGVVRACCAQINPKSETKLHYRFVNQSRKLRNFQIPLQELSQISKRQLDRRRLKHNLSASGGIDGLTLFPPRKESILDMKASRCEISFCFHDAWSVVSMEGGMKCPVTENSEFAVVEPTNQDEEATENLSYLLVCGSKRMYDAVQFHVRLVLLPRVSLLAKGIAPSDRGRWICDNLEYYFRKSERSTPRNGTTHFKFCFEVLV